MLSCTCMSVCNIACVIASIGSKLVDYCYILLHLAVFVVKSSHCPICMLVTLFRFAKQVCVLPTPRPSQSSWLWARKLLLILPSHGGGVEGWVDLCTAVKVCSSWPRLYITAAPVTINKTACSMIGTWSSHTAVGCTNHSATETWETRILHRSTTWNVILLQLLLLVMWSHCCSLVNACTHWCQITLISYISFHRIFSQISRG